MDFERFQRYVEMVRRDKPFLFELDSEEPATPEEIVNAESSLGCKLPEEYSRFVKIFGGGYFGFTNVFSPKRGFWSIVDRNYELPKDFRFVAFSDNGVGDLYGFRVIDSICESSIVLFDHETSEIESTEFTNLFEYLVSVGLHGS